MPANHTAMNTIIDGAVLLEIHLILPPVFVGVDEVFANEAGNFQTLLYYDHHISWQKKARLIPRLLDWPAGQRRG
jgi:hypothetical protein